MDHNPFAASTMSEKLDDPEWQLHSRENRTADIRMRRYRLPGPTLSGRSALDFQYPILDSRLFERTAP